MNRKKKINQTLIAKDKKKKAKLHGKNKPKYISKALRESDAQQKSLELLTSLELQTSKDLCASVDGISEFNDDANTCFFASVTQPS